METINKGVRWVTPVHAVVASATSVGQCYDVVYNPDLSRWECGCKGFAYRGSCRHIFAVTASRPTPRYCEHCLVDIARQGSCFCSAACRDASAAADVLSIEAPTAAPIPHSVCYSCQREYSYTEANPIFCPACRTARRLAVV